MTELMKKNDLAIVSSSGILFECLSVGIPCITGFYTDNQKMIYHSFENLKMVIPAGDILKNKQNFIYKLLDQDISKTIQSLVQFNISYRKIKKNYLRSFNSLINENSNTY